MTEAQITEGYRKANADLVHAIHIERANGTVLSRLFKIRDDWQRKMTSGSAIGTRYVEG